MANARRWMPSWMEMGFQVWEDMDGVNHDGGWWGEVFWTGVVGF